jgi:NAD(P)-dependent dehydrogenase (short-subunit alcohol dehydrogenase family)
VVLASRRVDRLKETRAEIEAEGGAAHVVAMDVTDLASVQAAVAEAAKECGGIDILINNSGVSTTSRLVDVTPDDYDYVFNTNTRGAFFVAQTVAKHMIERAKAQAQSQAQGAPYGRIVNIASVAGLKVLAQIGTYAMSKAAVIQMTKAMALEWGRFNINVNAICPGYIVTELNSEHFNSPAGQKLIQVLPRKRAGAPGDLDGLILLLSSDNSNFINGAVITADDGLAI